MASKIYYKKEGLKFKKQDSNQSAFYIDSSGNFGIETGTPEERLHIAGEFDIETPLIINGNIYFNESNKINSLNNEIIFDNDTTQLSKHLSINIDNKIYFTDTNVSIYSNNNNEITIDADNVKPTENLLIASDKKIYFNTGVSIYSSSNNELTITSSEINIKGNLIITGDLKFDGGTSFKVSNDFDAQNKNLLLASGSASNSDANAGGITLKASSNGSSDKKITYESSDNNWKSNIDFKVGSNITLGTNGTITGTAFKPGNFNISGSTISLSNGDTITFDKHINMDTNTLSCHSIKVYEPPSTNPTARQITNQEDLEFPVGSILMVQSDTSNSKFGFTYGTWKICDGTNGTPDLINRFVLGHNAAKSTFAQDTDGSAEVRITMEQIPSHTHTINNYNARHQHQGQEVVRKEDSQQQVPPWGEAPAYNQTWATIGNNFSTGGNDGSGEAQANFTYVPEWTVSNELRTTSTSGAHTHTIQQTGGGGTHNNLPPYYRLIYIMRTA